MAKGSEFEREFCKDLSLWWTYGEREDIFWRSSNSGGRATVRAARGKTTSGQYGDVAAIDVSGNPLLELVTIELKRGYSKHTIQDVFDRKPKSAIQQWEKWYEQTVISANNAKSISWLLITRRDQRDSLVYMPSKFYESLCLSGSFAVEPSPILQFTTRIRLSPLSNFTKIDPDPDITMMRWEDWKEGTSQMKLQDAMKELR